MRIFEFAFFYVKSQHKILHKTKIKMVLSKSKHRQELTVEGQVYLEKLKVIDENAEELGQRPSGKRPYVDSSEIKLIHTRSIGNDVYTEIQIIQPQEGKIISEEIKTNVINLDHFKAEWKKNWKPTIKPSAFWKDLFFTGLFL